MTEARHLSLKHAARLPEDASNGQRHPTIIALHGRGSDQADLLALAPYLDDRLLWISPRAPLDLEGGFEWYRLASIGQPDQATFDEALKTLERFIDEAVAAYPVDPQRLYLLGFSQGSMLGQAFTLIRPGKVAGIAAHSGYLPLTSTRAGGQIDEAGIAGKPILMLHGTQDQVIPVAWARQARDYLVSLAAEVEYYEFPMGHNVSDRSLAAADQWFSKQLEKAE